MTPLSWNEIRQRAIKFSKEWEGVTEERSEAQTFWNEFFTVFGMRRRLFASFEQRVKSLKNTYNRIDLLWKNILLAEHKSAGEDLDKAKSQAIQYIHDLENSGRNDELPRYIILSDFKRIVLYDLEPAEGEPERIAFALKDLHENVRHFAFFIGQQTHKFREQSEADLKAAGIMAGLHDAVSEGKYDSQSLERLLVRLLFCLFADDTGIFEPDQFRLFIENRTREDGSDLGAQLNALFDTLNTPVSERSRHLDEDLAAFPFVNGKLFSERLPVAGFDRIMRNHLVAACNFDWSRISPAIFGSLFQGILDARERRQIGAHYTSEKDILKVIKPLFLDDLYKEYERIEKDRSTLRLKRLREFQRKLASLKFLDPACGCGNFLVIAYRELRLLEMKVLQLIDKIKPIYTPDLPAEWGMISQVDVNRFYGIEIGQWAARIAETALWLTDHQMNVELSRAFGNLFIRIPLKEAPHIKCANALALQFDWSDLLPVEECSYILGNPPFVGGKFQTPEQRDDLQHVAGNVKNSGLLDYVTLWYFKALDYIKGTNIRCAFVSTNSITQGEQAGVLWSELLSRGLKIHFAHRTFSWQSEARGKAHVHVVIIGFGLDNHTEKRLFEYDDIKGEPTERKVKNISPYLVEGGDIVIQNRSKPLCDVPEMGIGNKPIDGGHYLFTDEEKKVFLAIEPKARKYFRPWIGSHEFLHGYHRWCLWLGDTTPEELRNLPECKKRIAAVRRYRMRSNSGPTKQIADIPRRFHVENFPKADFLVLPEVSSEKRDYIPIGNLSPPVICSNLVKIIPDATPYHFGILTSAMHMAWVRTVGGRLKSDFRYSIKLLYNNFPWPPDPTESQQSKVVDCAEEVLSIRQKYLDEENTYADLYDPLLMPAELRKAHQKLDRAVDRCYRGKKFESERDRVEFLFQLYEQLNSPLMSGIEKPKRRTRKKKDS